MDRLLQLNPLPVVLFDAESRIVQVSRGFERISGISNENCAGLGVSEFASRVDFMKRFSTFEDGFRQAIAQKDQVASEAVELDSVYWRTRTVPIFDDAGPLLAIALEIEDVTQQCLQAQELRQQVEASKTYRLLVNTVRDYAIFMLDSTGHIATWNTGAGILKQYKANEIIGKHFSTFYSKADRDARIPEMELEVAIRDGKFEDSGWRYRKDGSKFWANVVITPTYDNDVLVGFTKVTRDMTERHQAEERLIEEYEEASKLKSQFLANMSHEIRSPMHGMLSAVTLLIETGLDEEQRELAAIIEDSGSILLQVINDILDYSKLSSGVFQMSKIDMSITDTVNAVTRSTLTGVKPGLALESEVDPNLPSLVKGDPLRLRQVLQNLLVNAVKFTEVGSIKVKVGIVKEQETSVEVLAEVIDTGVGVPPQAVDLLFTPFTQVDNSVTKKYKGTGLGLSISKSLVELMGGTIGYRPNRNGIGSTFWFTVRLEKSKTIESRPADNGIVPTIMKATAGKNVLLVEDNPVNQKVMHKTLSKLGFQNVDIADDGRQGVDTFHKGRYDLVIMDVSMPVLDGVAATKEIRESESNTPIIAMTANALKGDEERFINAGMSDYIAKPVDRRLLTNLLVKWLT